MRNLLLILSLFLVMTAQAQIEVSEFYRADTDLSAMELRDVDGDLYSIIKIRTESPNLNLNEIDAEVWSQMKGEKTRKVERNGRVVELWVYARYGETGIKLFYRNSTKEIKFNSLQPGTNIGKGEVYMMILRSNSDSSEPLQQWVVFHVEPKNALVTLGDEQILVDADGTASKYVNVGSTLHYKVECRKYHPDEGDVVVHKQKKELTIKLKPAFGTLRVDGNNGAIVYVDKENRGKAPITIEGIPSGNRTVQIVMPKYKSWSGVVTVRDEETTAIAPELEPNFATLTFKVADGAEIWINGQKRGTGSVRGDFEAGSLLVETRKTGHSPVQKSFYVEANQNRTITLDPPTPIYGSLNIISSPQNADVEIDGQKVGTTPWVQSRLIIGQHDVAITKEGYNPYTTQITIEENKRRDLNVTLTVGREITITTNGVGDDIYIDGKHAGQSPLKVVMSYGKHSVTAVNGKKTAAPKSIYVQKQGGIDRMHLNLKKESFASYASSGYGFMTIDALVNKYGDVAYGLTLGKVGGVDWFVSAASNFDVNGLYYDYECGSDFLVNGIYPGYTGNMSYTSLSVMIGTLVQVSPIAVRAGIGYGIRNVVHETTSGYWVKNTSTSCQGIDFMLGLQANLKGFVFSVDYVLVGIGGSYDYYDYSDANYEIRIGIGYGIRHR